MRTIQRYITTDFLIVLLSTLVVFTFVMCLGIIGSVADLIAKGVAMRPLLMMVVWGIPLVLAFSLPSSLLTASLLVFGRLSADGEITAMRACGVRLSRMAAPIVLLSVAASLVCVYLNNQLIPDGHYQRRVLVSEMGVGSAGDLITPGRFLDFPGLSVYVGRKKKNYLQDIRIYDHRNAEAVREIRAESGALETGPDGKALEIRLFNVRVDPFDDHRPGPAFMNEWGPIRIVDTHETRTCTRREEDLRTGELVSMYETLATSFREMEAKDLATRRMAIRVELQQRVVLAAACVAFTILGVPLGITTRRKESSIGVLISLAILVTFYVAIVIAKSLVEHPQFRADLLLWLPVVLSLGLGWFLWHRAR